jgi:hypothetical protein
MFDPDRSGDRADARDRLNADRKDPPRRSGAVEAATVPPPHPREAPGEVVLWGRCGLVPAERAHETTAL